MPEAFLVRGVRTAFGRYGGVLAGARPDDLAAHVVAELVRLEPLGHPLGASGARLALTAATEMSDRQLRRALATMCIGVGQGIAVLLEAA
ncbi:MAG TPA: hypothetical protein VGC05_09840 [Mycobacterium sp.]